MSAAVWVPLFVFHKLSRISNTITAHILAVWHWLIFFFSDIVRKKVFFLTVLVLYAVAFYALGYVGGQTRYADFETEMDRLATSLAMDLRGETWPDRFYCLSKNLKHPSKPTDNLPPGLMKKRRSWRI